ncbi:MAG TPA: hypothetical protein VHN36_21055 [Ilumatobacteraceae bacterium]|nr:hypothetical protein [Ilumatobacteraceae bacterium]
MSPSSHVKRYFGVVLSAVLLAIGAPIVALIGTADAVQVTSAGFVTSAQVDRAQAPAGQSVAIHLSVKSDTARNVLIDIEIYDRSARKVFQKYADNQSFAAGQTRPLSVTWSTTGLGSGPYSVKIGVFGAGWSSFIHWNDQAAAVTLTTTAPTTTTRPSTTTTRPPTTTTTPPTTTTRPTTTTTTTTTTTSVPPGRFTTLPVGATLPTGAQCAARVRPAAEIRADNTVANNNRGSRANANTRTDWSGFSRVDGDYAGTTDQLIQWAACKWGIDEDIVRAQAIKESGWHQSGIGDNGDSFGITQVRQSAHPSAFQFSVNAKNSTAYNLDYTYAIWRGCYEGVYTWLNTVEHNGTYAAGDVWGCVGLWFSGRWYVNTDAYLNQTGDSVHWHYTNKTWLTSAFING